jgi:hypothetical protein
MSQRGLLSSGGSIKAKEREILLVAMADRGKEGDAFYMDEQILDH